MLLRRWVWISGSQALGGPPRQPRKGLPSLTRAWQRAELSNLDYLMELNLMAGRRVGDLTRYPLLPWVLDMTEPPEAGMSAGQVPHRISFSRASLGTQRRPLFRHAVHAKWLRCGLQAQHTDPQAGWRDLSRSKWRLAKGDEQLDATFADSAHHVSDDALSELAACIYKARVMVPVLAVHTRARWADVEAGIKVALGQTL